MKIAVVFFLAFLGFAVSCANVPDINRITPVDLGDQSFFPTITAQTHAPILAGNRVELLFNGDEIVPAMLRAIRGARKSITYSQYLYKGGEIAYEFAQAFAERCRAGVEVKILLDSHGSADIPEEIPKLWREAGCRMEEFRRIRLFQFITPWELLNHNYRNHRRVLVIDGEIGFTGGHAVAEAWTGDGRTKDHWRDTNARVEGPIVQHLQAAFVESWRETTGDVISGDVYFPPLEPRGDAHAQVVKSAPLGGSYETYLLFLLAITSAKKSIYITNPYFLPNERMTKALFDAVSRGVRVILLTPGPIDRMLVYRASRKGFGALLLGGMEIHEYQRALLHAKTMVVDGLMAIVGSTNLDNRSFALNQEINLITYEANVAAELQEAFYEDLQHSSKLTYEEWKSRPWHEKILELFALPLKEQL